MRLSALLLPLFLAFSPVSLAAPPAPDAMVQMLKTIDDRQQNNGDWNSQVYIEQKEAGKSDLVYQANIYRQDDKDTLVILFVKPAAEAGKGYLRVDKNLFFYDPASGAAYH